MAEGATAVKAPTERRPRHSKPAADSSGRSLRASGASTAAPAISLHHPSTPTSRPLSGLGLPVTAALPALGLSPTLGAALRSPGQGQPLPAPVASRIGTSLGVSLDSVRVHSGPRARAAAGSVGARAFTWGPNVFLGPGQQATDVKLMAHEVAHVIQQQGSPALQLYTPTAGDRLEREARSASAAVLQGSSFAVLGRTGGLVIQREEASVIPASVAGWIHDHARQIPGYDLLAFVLGRDPITQQPVDRNATNLIRAVTALIPGGREKFDQLMQTGVIQRAADWFSAEIPKLGITWDMIRGLIARAWQAVSITDLLDPAAAWAKVRAIFDEPARKVINFAISAGRKLLEFIFEGAMAMAGGAGQRILAIFRNIGDTFELIIADPVAFLGHLLDAVKGGFAKFVTNIAAHLRRALFEWLTGALAGAIQLPERWDLRGIISVVLQVLGLTYQRMREKLVKLIGEPAVRAIETAFDFIKSILTGGLAAAWQKILEFAGGLIDTVIGAIRDWVARSVVGAAVTRLLTLFNPVGAVIQGILAIYNTVMFFVERAQQIAALVDSIVTSIGNIARGNIGAAIDYVEATLARTLPVIISFLARLIGLGDIGGTVKAIIERIQGVVSAAIDRVVAWVINAVKAILARVSGQGADPPAQRADTPEAAAVKSEALGEVATRTRGSQVQSIDALHAILVEVRNKYTPRGLKALTATVTDDESLAIRLEAKASDPTPILLRWEDVFAKHDPDDEFLAELQTHFARQEIETYAAIAVGGRIFGEVSTSTAAGHAEQNLLGRDGNSPTWNQAIAHANSLATAGAGPVQVTVLINRAPCHDKCTDVLSAAIATARAQSKANVRFVLAPTGVYEATNQTERNRIIRQVADEIVKKKGIPLTEAKREARSDPGVPEPAFSAGTTRLQDLFKLAGLGWDIRQLLARPAATVSGRILGDAIGRIRQRAKEDLDHAGH